MSMKTVEEWNIEMIANLKEAINLMLVLNDDKNMTLSDKDIYKFTRIRKQLK